MNFLIAGSGTSMYGMLSAHHLLYARTCVAYASAGDIPRYASYSPREADISSVTKPSCTLTFTVCPASTATEPVSRPSAGDSPWADRRGKIVVSCCPRELRSSVTPVSSLPSAVLVYGESTVNGSDCAPVPLLVMARF